MRCPKCGYITFDHLETCTKCRKKIAAVSEQLSGTIFKAEPPAFLQVKVQKIYTEDDISTDVLQEGNDIDVEFALDGEEEAVEAASADNEIEFDFMDEGADSPASKGDVDTGEDDFDLELFADEESSDELSLEGADSDEAEDHDGLQLDFSDLDISDLAPPEADEPVSAELTLENGTGVSAAKGKKSSLATMGAGGNLEDLQMDGLDLEMPSLPPAGSATGKGLRPAVKTGTALDGFDIDLGELLSDRDK